MARQTPCIPAEPIYSSAPLIGAPLIADRKYPKTGVVSFIWASDTVDSTGMTLTKFCHIFCESLFSGTVLQVDTRAPLVSSLCVHLETRPKRFECLMT